MEFNSYYIIYIKLIGLVYGGLCFRVSNIRRYELLLPILVGHS